VAIYVKSVEQARRDMALAAEAGADLVELRVDEFPAASGAALKALLKESIIPAIVTCRPIWEGGQSELEDEDRAIVLESAVRSGARFVDIELKALKQSEVALDEIVENAMDGDSAQVIVSSHDFTGRPEKLYNILTDLDSCGGDINKIVWTARTVRDNIEVFEALKTRQKPTIALCMGEAGLISRVLAKKFGAFLTFASLETDSGTAPGQISIADMKQLYRWDEINATTSVYGVVASPVKHSMSPAIHNAAFDKIGFDGVYLPLLVEPSYESFKAFMEMFLGFKPLHLSGLSITLPHKENALRYLTEKHADVEELAKRIGAVNTIAISPEGELQGTNTDYAAILDSITAKLNCTREALAEKRVAVIGAGGTGRTAVAALASCGATVVVYNRTKERADALAEEFNGKSGQVVSARMEKLCDSCCHVFINTTSVGMHPNVNESPLGEQDVKFTPETVVFDTIYNPIKTKLLQQAEAAGAKTIGGVEMFVRQAAGQFKLWTGREAPVDVMRKVIESHLNG